MILECPECRTRYLVPDTAIGVDGRTVRCASCRHSWFQAGPEAIDPALIAPAAVPVAAVADPAPDLVRADAYAHAAQPVAEDAPRDYDPFAHEPPFKPRRNPEKRWTAAAAIAGLSLTLGAGAIIWTGAPGIAAQFGLPIGASETPLIFTAQSVVRKPRLNGGELFVVSGQVMNPTKTAQRVPNILAELRNDRNDVVYSWTITPEPRTLPPGGSLDFNSGKLDVPQTGKTIQFSFSGEGGG